MDFGGLMMVMQIVLAIIIGMYFLNLLQGQQGSKHAVQKESRKELEKLAAMRAVKLTEPLAEKTRPACFQDIVGQEDGLKALRAALCGPNPQHVIVYGPPGIGKTAAARVVLEEAKRSPGTPFAQNAKFIEVDATTVRYDERGIADPLIGSVHDPIYQGAGPMGMAGIPQPKMGAVTRAHGGVLFLDEIGDLPPVQMNKLLKVLEDRKVILESAYYNSEDANVPEHIHDIFQNGLPADFRLVGATTRNPEELPPALRSRCVEVFFRPLTADDVTIIVLNAARRLGTGLEPGALETARRFAKNGREAVNLVQIAASVSGLDGRHDIRQTDIEWVVNSSQMSPRLDRHIPEKPLVGVVNGLAVMGNVGALLEIEVSAVKVEPGRGQLTITGVVDEEEIGTSMHVTRRKSMIRGSLENVMTVLKSVLHCDSRDYDIHVNFPGGAPADGPSAGISMATAIYSAISGRPVDNLIAMTGELSVRGNVNPVGGVTAKIEAARQAGAQVVLIPAENWQSNYDSFPGVSVVSVRSLQEVILRAVLPLAEENTKTAN
jgi:Lon-like ATP-dependent protease